MGAIIAGDQMHGGAGRYRPKNSNKTRAPAVLCPVCMERAFTRTSEEISPETRRLYYACSNIHCGMTWQSMLTVEKVISPSAISREFRPMQFKVAKPPGHDFGQMALFDMPVPASEAG